MNSIAKTAVELSVADMDVLLQGLNVHTTDLCNKMVVSGPASRAVLCTRLDAATAIGQSLIDAQARLTNPQARDSIPAIDDDTGRPIARPLYLVIEGNAYWLECTLGAYYLCTAPLSAYSNAVLWDEDTEVDIKATSKHAAIVSALIPLVKRDDDLLDALKAMPVVKDALNAIANAKGKSTFGNDWMDALK